MKLYFFLFLVLFLSWHLWAQSSSKVFLTRDEIADLEAQIEMASTSLKMLLEHSVRLETSLRESETKLQALAEHLIAQERSWTEQKAGWERQTTLERLVLGGGCLVLGGMVLVLWARCR